MAEILFVNSNLYGHINPTLSITEELVNNGNHVCYFCAKQFEEEIRSLGAEFIDYGKKQESFLEQYRPTDRHPFYMLMEYMLKYVEVLLPELLAHIREKNYDIILCDSIFGAGYFLKQILNIPVVCSHSSFAMNSAPVPPQMLVAGIHPQLDECYRVLKRICSLYKIEEPGLDEIFISKGELNLVYTTKEFNGNDDLEDEKYLYTRSYTHVRKETEKLDMELDGKKIIYISLGTINTDFLAFFKLCINAFVNTKYTVIMSLGKKCKAGDLSEIPDNFVVKQQIPQLEVLKYASVFISHAGFNSANEALYHGVPIIAIPMVNDQHMVAKRLVDLGVGVRLKMEEVTEDSLYAMVNEVILNENMHFECKRISQSMQQASDNKVAIERIEKLAERR